MTDKGEKDKREVCPECQGRQGYTTWGADNMDVDWMPCDGCNGAGFVRKGGPPR